MVKELGGIPSPPRLQEARPLEVTLLGNRRELNCHVEQARPAGGLFGGHPVPFLTPHIQRRSFGHHLAAAWFAQTPCGFSTCPVHAGGNGPLAGGASRLAESSRQTQREPHTVLRSAQSAALLSRWVITCGYLDVPLGGQRSEAPVQSQACTASHRRAPAVCDGGP